MGENKKKNKAQHFIINCVTFLEEINSLSVNINSRWAMALSPQFTALESAA